MKYYFTIAIILLLSCNGIYASTVISSGYSYGNRCEYIIGEPVAGSVGTGNMLTAGFLQGVIEVVESGVEDIVRDEGIMFKLFPNPVKALLKIARTHNTEAPDENMELFLYGNNGTTAYHCILKNDVSEIDLSHLAEGIYIVCIRNASGEKIFESKIIKNNA